MRWDREQVLRALAIAAAVIYTLLGLLLLLVMRNVSELPLCEDREAVALADECIEASSTERALGLVAGWGATLGAALAIVLGIGYAGSRRRGGALVAAIVLTPALALLALLLLPLSF